MDFLEKGRMLWFQLLVREFTLFCAMRSRLLGQVYHFSLLICYPYSFIIRQHCYLKPVSVHLPSSVHLSIWINTLLKSLHLRILLLLLILLKNFCEQKLLQYSQTKWFLHLVNIHFHRWTKFRNLQDMNFSGWPSFKKFLGVPLFKKFKLKTVTKILYVCQEKKR